MEKYKFTRNEEAKTFVCARCVSTKISKNMAVREDGKKMICNGCFGYLLAKKEIERIQ